MFLLGTIEPVQSDAFGGKSRGTSSAQFLNIAPGARAVGMGEAYGGVAEGVYSAYYNPAGLAFIEKVEIGAARDQHFQDITHSYGAIAVPLLSWRDARRRRNALGTAALSVTSLSIEDIERRGLVETDSPQGSFEASDFAYSLAYGFALSQRFAIGGAAKLVQQNLDSVSGSAFAIDGGVLLRAERLSLGLGIRNFGQGIKLGTEKDPLPTMVYGGLAYRPSKTWLAAAELRQPNDDTLQLSLGVEFVRSFNKRMSGALRVGFNSANMDAGGLGGVTFGGGVVYKRTEFAIAWAPMGELGSTFRYSVEFKF
ncbi:MAG: hypothetical protein COB53_02540 [Elusimicrobia bacterium]|nr:MAG: hypothetical protein COB53_02540 [Elusimicrobiota bacterium]